MDTFHAFRIHKTDGTISSRMDDITLDDLSDGDVVLRTAYSGINYKDALAATGAIEVVRRFPMVGGIDAAGTVSASTDDRLQPGDAAVVVGGGLSETRDGGYAEYVRVPADIVVPVPEGLTPRDTMAIGTAGFAAAMSVIRMEQNGQTPSTGPVAVNGATGGVGSYAIDMLANRGYEVHAITRKDSAADYLRSLGAAKIVNSAELQMGDKPLEPAVFGGAVDSVGGRQLAWLTRSVAPTGNIASVGLAGGAELQTTVMPFILRGISLLGINTVTITRELRQMVWQRLATDLKPRHLETIVTREVTFDQLANTFDQYIAGTVQGRTLVRVS